MQSCITANPYDNNKLGLRVFMSSERHRFSVPRLARFLTMNYVLSMLIKEKRENIDQERCVV